MNRLILVGALGLIVAVGAVILNWRTAPAPSADLSPYGAANAQEAAEIDTSSIVEMTLGNPDAKVTVMEYASFTCPHCARFHEGQFKQLKAEYIDTGLINFVYRDVYFDRFGLWASMVARCGGQERFFGIADMIYDQQRDWVGSGQDPAAIANNLRKIGKVAGLDEDQLEACLNDNDKAKTLVAWYQKNAEADGIRSTPTLLINGTSYSNMSYEELKGLIDEALAE
ncbi:DsbA family protein [Roseovarius faecimaris]|uniref:DsbA family protein n=1 Tax=Roseovarius faecimaris TaxID=2494550 RepID=A0A6I6IWM1_9RHOB|nr:DsbA family protein [Roseovarius faecimaris]QGX99856.1 DsbA family protein [Roseovarius faecimaris]